MTGALERVTQSQAQSYYYWQADRQADHLGFDSFWVLYSYFNLIIDVRLSLSRSVLPDGWTGLSRKELEFLLCHMYFILFFPVHLSSFFLSFFLLLFPFYVLLYILSLHLYNFFTYWTSEWLCGLRHLRPPAFCQLPAYFLYNYKHITMEGTRQTYTHTL
jgi:hypothetical protein